MEDRVYTGSGILKSYLESLVGMGFSEVMLARERKAPGDAPSLEEIRRDLGECVRCRLHEKRLSIVFGEGNPSADLMFVGEGPGADEDRQGRPFVGKAGQLLTRMIQAMGLDRSQVYIGNIVKCRPPGNRAPQRDEMDRCFPFLEAQIAVVRPKVIVALGKVAAGALLETTEPISKMRGKFRDRKGVRVMPTYHPSFLLREGDDKSRKKEAWEDLKQVMAELGLPLPDRGDKR